MPKKQMGCLILMAGLGLLTVLYNQSIKNVKGTFTPTYFNENESHEYWDNSHKKDMQEAKHKIVPLHLRRVEKKRSSKKDKYFREMIMEEIERNPQEYERELFEAYDKLRD